MTTIINNEHKKLNFSNEREQSHACLNSAEHEKNQGRKVLNVPNLRFPEFKGEWEKCTLGNNVKIQGGYAFKSELFLRKGIPIIRISNLPQNASFVDLDDCTYYKEGNYNSFEVHNGDLLIAMSGATTGKTAIYNRKTLAYLNQRVGLFKSTNRDSLYYPFLYALVSTPVFKRQLSTRLIAGAQPNISSSDIESIRISIPQKNEQEKIAHLMLLLDERITTQNKIIEDLKKLKSAIIDYAINSLDSGFVKFGSLYEMAGEGGTPTTSNASFYDNGKIPFIKIDDLKKKYLTENKDFITELGLQKSSAWLVPSRSILFSNGATIGEITITTYPVCTKQGILGIVPKPNIDVEFLYYFMSSSYFKKAVSRIVTEGTMKTAYLKDINNIRCPIPIKEKQQDIAKMPSALNSKIDFEQSILKLFCSQKQYLLCQMFM